MQTEETEELLETEDEAFSNEVASEDNEVAEILEDAKKEAEKDDEPIAETPQESARKALEELQSAKQSDGDSSQEAPNEKQQLEGQTNEPKKRGRPPLPKVDANDPEMRPPLRFDLQAKEAFNKAPPQVRKAIHKAVRDLEAMSTRATQEASKHANEARHIVEAVRPYLLAHPELAERGITESVFVSGLVAAHQKLISPETKEKTFIELAHSTGNAHLLRDDAGQSASSQPDIANHPVVQQLIEQNKRLQQMIEPGYNRAQQAQRSEEERLVDSITAELSAVQNETDAYGNYVYPELHDEAFVKKWNPLVSALVGTAGKSYADAAKQAVLILRSKPEANQVNQAKSPARNIAVSAASNIRGRSISGVAATNKLETESIPRNESPAESAMRALEELRRGLN